MSILCDIQKHTKLNIQENYKTKRFFKYNENIVIYSCRKEDQIGEGGIKEF